MAIERRAGPSAGLEAVERVVEQARVAFGPDLRSIVLFGSAAEDRLRPTSDVNLIFVLHRFDPAAVDRLRGDLLLARAAVRLDPMFLLSGEIDAAAAAFAVKFDDLRRRRRVLFGDDPFAGLAIDREAMRRRAEQVLLNLEMRLRRAYALEGGRDESLTRSVAEAAGPLRAAAATVLELRGEAVASAREALAAFATTLDDPALSAVPERIRQAREGGGPMPDPAAALLAVGRLASRLRAALRGDEDRSERSG